MKAFKKIRDKIILDRVKRGDTEAFGEVYDEYSDRIFRYLYFKVPNEQIAEDLTSNVFLKSWEYITQGTREVKSLQAFLYTTAHNLLIDYYRKRKEEAPLDKVEYMAGDLTESLEKEINIKQDIAVLLKAISNLSDEHSDVITLKYVEEYTVSEMSDLLGKTENNIRVTLHRAIKSLKQSIDLKNE